MDNTADQYLEQMIDLTRDRFAEESAKTTKKYLNVDFVKAALAGATPGPWDWTVYDYSMAGLVGPAHEYDHVLNVSPCKSCQARATEWEWGRCGCPTEPNATLISMAPTLAEEYIRMSEQPKYPVVVDDHLYQYGENVFVWYDEAGLIGGASETLESAKRQQNAYLASINMTL